MLLPTILVSPSPIAATFLPFHIDPSSLTVTSQAFGGYWSAQFTAEMNRSEMENWLDIGLGRDVKIISDAPRTIWVGFVNAITASLGSLSITRGPLMEVANSVQVRYSPLDTATSPPVTGVTTFTTASTDATSIALYGTLSKVIQGGNVTDADAAQIQQLVLESRRFPKMTKSFSSEATGDFSLSVNCLGYVHRLDYPYSVDTAGTSDANAKIAAVIAANPNIAWLPFDVAYLTTNTFQVPTADPEGSIGLNVIKSTTILGDAAQNRWLFGVYRDLECHYEAAPTAIEYLVHLSDSAVRITSMTGTEVKPWEVLPGKWAYVPDFLMGRSPGTDDLQEDPRALFIESVTYTAPVAVSLQGGTTDRLDQLLAQRGLAGASAA